MELGCSVKDLLHIQYLLPRFVLSLEKASSLACVLTERLLFSTDIGFIHSRSSDPSSSRKKQKGKGKQRGKGGGKRKGGGGGGGGKKGKHFGGGGKMGKGRGRKK